MSSVISKRNQSSPDLPSLRVVEVVDVIGRAVDVASEPQQVGLPPGVVGLGLDRGIVGGGKFKSLPLDADRQGSIAGTRLPREHERGLAVAIWPIGKVEVGVTRVQFLGKRWSPQPPRVTLSRSSG